MDGQKENLFGVIKDNAAIFAYAVLLLSIVFDVGYFYGIDINFFTLFSLAEHTLFTIEAIPNAFMLIICGVFVYLAFGNSVIRVSRVSNTLVLSGGLRSINKGGNISKLREWISINQFVSIVFIGIIIFTFIYIVVYNISNLIGVLMLSDRFPILTYISQRSKYELEIYSHSIPLFIGFISLMSAVSIYHSISRISYIKIYIFITVPIFAVIMSFTLGFDIARSYTSYKNVFVPQHLLSIKDVGDVSVRVIRSGDKGLLFYDIEVRSVKFVKWEDIEEIKSATLVK